MYATLLADTRFHELLLAIDRDLADSCRTEGCALCGGRLHSARYPRKPRGRPCRLGEVLYDLMAANDWIGVDRWARRANDIAPTIVGGSKKHGGPDLGPSGARNAWAALGVKGTSLADDAPARDYVGMPRLTIPMVAQLRQHEWTQVLLLQMTAEELLDGPPWLREDGFVLHHSA